MPLSDSTLLPSNTASLRYENQAAEANHPPRPRDAALLPVPALASGHSPIRPRTRLGVSAKKSRTGEAAVVALRMGAENGVVLSSGNVEQEVKWLAVRVYGPWSKDACCNRLPPPPNVLTVEFSSV